MVDTGRLVRCQADIGMAGDKMRSRSQYTRGVDDNFDVERFDPYHLPVNAEIVHAVISHPDTTYADLDALYFSVVNNPELGGCDPLINEILEAMQGVE